MASPLDIGERSTWFPQNINRSKQVIAPETKHHNTIIKILPLKPKTIGQEKR